MENEAEPPTLTSLGLTNEMQMALDRIISRPTGGLLVTGPTGSGKSTTLYAAMADIVHPQINAIMIEDPVERRLPGTFQMQVDERAGVDYEAALRSVLRADPDVLMVGEIRDPETARLTMGVSIAGHLVLSTLHTDDAPTAITRLLDMGVEPYLVASGTTAVLAQRLARRLCPACRDSYRPTPEELVSLGYEGEHAQSGEIELWRAIGCGQCRGGYRGRIGIFQLLLITPEIRRLTIEHSGREAIESAAKAAGMGSQWADGLAKAEQGLTSVDELWRVLT
jgi:type II secretory ATPase GspE/PulE/Tfp pilus assembly ATPase PilB-like protein